MATFQNYGELTEHLARAAAASVPGAKLGFSNQSCSAYVSVGIDPDEDGDCRDEFRLRFSDHAGRHGADMTIRIDRHAQEIRDADGDFAGIEIMDHHLEDLVAQAVEALQEAASP